MTALADVTAAILDALSAEYADEPETTVMAVPGQIVVHDGVWSVACHTVYVRLDSRFPTDVFPQPAVGATSCKPPDAARFHVGVLRCVAGPDEGGQPPSPADQTADAARIMADSDNLRAALCPVEARWGRGNTAIGAWAPLGPQGNVAGGWWPFTVRLVSR